MHNLSPKTNRMAKRVTVWLLLAAMLVQAFTGVFATTDLFDGVFGAVSGSNSGKVNGIGQINSEEIISQLKKDLMASINENLIKKVEEYELTGEVGVILTFEDQSLLEIYNSSSTYSKNTYTKYLATSAAKKQLNKITEAQDKVLTSLSEQGLISKVEHTYNSLLNGAFVRTTYENLSAITKMDGVLRITVSNTYEPAIAVENPVNVYPTGIFNPTDVDYTGKGTLVAILDTGCDYTHSAFNTHDVQGYEYDRSDIEAILSTLVAYSYDNTLEAREVYYGNITKNKIYYGYDYADKDPNILPFNSSHGTHVAGIIGGYDETITGVALDTQFAIMKVFSDYKQGAEDGDILAALEDSIKLGVDAINMSLGSSSGFAFEYDPDESYKNDLYQRIEDAGISLIVAAGNDFSSGFGSDEGNTNKTDNPDSGVVGSPGSYGASFTVASINGNKENYLIANGNQEVFFNEAVNANAKKYSFFEMLGINKDNPVKELEYVTVPGNGYAINYAGIDVKGKIALVRRGDITFEEKVRHACEAGAIGIIIYNNVFGQISMTVGNDPKIPVVSIGKDEGDAMAALEGGKLLFDFNNEAGPFMSDFSSWGPTPSLQLKPEITAHGGNIYSAIAGGEYEEQSGTSMASPNMCGITVLIRQYVMESYPELSTTEARDLVNRLCMSTATIAMDKKGNPYSPRKQGAGIADILKATTTPAYLYVEGIGKTKLELGDDPNRTGVYTMTVCLENLSDSAVSYKVGNIAMTESVSTSEPEYVAEMAYLLSSTATYSVQGGAFADGIVTVEGGKTAKITVTITLSDADRHYMNANFKNGIYVEGFLTFDSTAENGVDLNAPFLAFYGDWAEAPIFDLDYYEVETEAHNNAIDDDDKIKADYYATTPLGTYYYDYILPLGSYLYKMDESEYTPIPATEAKAALSYYSNSISGIYGVFTGLLRGAKEMNITIVDTATGEVVWEDTQYNCYKAHYGGVAYPYISRFNLPMVDEELGRVFGGNNSHYEVTMSAKLDWEGGNDNISDTYSFSFYIDYEAPSVVDATFRTEYDKGRKENRYYVDMMVYDNHYAMSVRPILVQDVVDSFGRDKKSYTPLVESSIPIYQENIGEVTKVTMEITDYIDTIAESAVPDGITIYIDDYALNGAAYFIPFPETDSLDLEFETSELALDLGQTFDLTTYLSRKGETAPIESNYLKTLEWSTSDANVVTVKGGKIEAVGSGTAKISVTGSNWTFGEERLKKTIIINVSENFVEDPNSSQNVKIESIKFTGYKTLFAFNGDIDPSEIGRTGMINYFGNSANISCYPDESIQLHFRLTPWNMDEDRYYFSWETSNPRVATVNEKGEVTAVAEGSARITLRVFVDGKPSLLTARCNVEVKSEFVIENRTLVAYKSKKEYVEIPDDEGIMYIGAYAFAHYNMDNEFPVEKDEDGWYDIDLKKFPIGNDTLVEVIIPEDVETINKYAFYNCSKLKNVTLPESCKTIEISAFEKCAVLENVNLDYVNIIGNNAFNGCASLTCNELGGINLSGVYAIGAYAFAGTRLSDITLDDLSLTGEGAFYKCTYLKNVTLGKMTRVSAKMFKESGLEKITVYGDYVGDEAFMDCKQLTTVNLNGDLTYLGNKALANCSKLTAVNFNAVCEIIGVQAFSECDALVSLTLPDCKVSVGSGAFENCNKFTTLVFDENTEFAGGGFSLFIGRNKYSIDVSTSTKYELKSDGAIYTKDGETLVAYIPSTASTFTVGKNVKKIADGAFSSNPILYTVNFESGSKLESIGYGAFANCSALKNVNLPAKAVNIAESAFMNDTALTNIDLSHVASVATHAFASTALTSVSLTADNVKIGDEAFIGCTRLQTLTLGNGATIGVAAFNQTALNTIEVEGNGVTVGLGAFYGCTSLKNVDFEGFSGRLGDLAFYACTSLTSVYAPNITEIGNATFADIPGLTSLSAEKVTTVGAYAFSVYNENSTTGAAFETVYLPALTTVGNYAFFSCQKLTSIDLSKVTTLGEGAFARCTSLTTATLSEKLTVIPAYAFIECTSLTDVDFTHMVHIGDYSFVGVVLPETLNLASAKYIGTNAFVATVDGNALKTVIAPQLKEIGNQAFAGCTNLTTFTATSLETVGTGAFVMTAITRFQVTDSLKKIGNAAFSDIEGFEAFYVIVDGVEKETAEVGNVMVSDGVLYLKNAKGYTLVCYPESKSGDTYEVVEGTYRIEFFAAGGNKNLEKVILPESLKYIGDYAFYMCDALKTVVFKSYYAPVLEGSMTGEAIEITPENKDEFPGFTELYGSDYFFFKTDEGKLGNIYYYRTFKGTVGSKDAQGMTYIVPEESKGYDTKIYMAFFEPSTENSGKAMGPYAIAFIEAANKLPEVATRFDRKVVEAAIGAFNALQNHAEELALVDKALIEEFDRVRSQFYIDVAEDLIAHIFDINNSEYCFNLLKEAKAAFDVLTATEQAQVVNAGVLDAKLSELTAAMGKTPDFSLTYAENMPQTPDDPTEPPAGGDDEPGTGDSEPKAFPVAIVIIIVAVVVIGGAVVAVVVLKKKKN